MTSMTNFPKLKEVDMLGREWSHTFLKIPFYFNHDIFHPIFNLGKILRRGEKDSGRNSLKKLIPYAMDFDILTLFKAWKVIFF